MNEILSAGVTGLGAALIAVPWVIIFGLPFLALFGIPFFLALNAFFRVKKRPMSVLVVDDDEGSVVTLLSILACKKNIEVRVVQSGPAMIEELKMHEYDLLFLDRFMPGQTGDDALIQADLALSSGKDVSVVFFSGAVERFQIPNLKHIHSVGLWGKQSSYQALDSKVSRLLLQLRTNGIAA